MAAPQGTVNSTLKNSDGSWKQFAAGDKIPSGVKVYAPTKLDQGTGNYLTDIGHTMNNSSIQDGRNEVGQGILNQGNNVHYVPVRTTADQTGTEVTVLDSDGAVVP
jgi:hypothetical protein